MEPKKWDELTEAEKIERLRAELRGTRMLLQVLLGNMQRMQHHTHGDHGALMVPMALHEGGGMQRGGIPDPLA